MTTSILHSQNVRFQITIYLVGNLDFFSINTFMCVLNQGAHTSFSKKIFWKQIRMSLVLEYDWHEPAVFTKHKHIILTWENSLKYSTLQLSFALPYEWCYNEKRLKLWWYPTMDKSARNFRSVNINRYIGCNTTNRRTGVFDQGVFAKACKNCAAM
jgi:hypothetical protein